MTTTDLADMIVRCWCCPPHRVYIMPSGNPCTWPDCLNGDRPDPNATTPPPCKEHRA